jgi:hypothetical protein
MANKRFSQYTDFVENIDDTLYSSGESWYIAAGPPRLANIGGSVSAAGQLTTGTDSFVRKLGHVQNFSLGQSMNLFRYWEIGSMRSYFIPGKVVGNINLGRVFYHGPSLLRALYAYYQDLIPPTIVPSVFPNTVKLINPHNVIIPPGYENVFLNLASDMFRQPVGMLIYMKDSNDNTLGATYVEQTFVQGHQFSMDSQGIVQQESCSLQYERLVPVAVSSLGLVTDILNPLST